MESKGRFIALFIANLLFVFAAIGSVIFASVYWDSAKKKDYDMSGVVFDDLTVEYDGLPHSILATNLPQGVTASYENNDQTDMGEYIVTAHFKGDEKRYNPIPDMTAALNIIQPARSRIMSAIGFEIDETGEPPRIFCDVSNAIEYIDLTDKITVTPNCIWKLFKDFDGEEVTSKAMSLETGHNTAYIKIYEPSDNTSVYEVDVYRLAMKSYIFKNEGQVHASGTIEEKSQLLGPEIPEKPYYTFTGWAVEGSRDIVRFPYTVTEDITFVAQYTPTNYKITYYLDGGTNDARNPAFYNIEMSDIELLPASRTGYIFDGWYSDRQFDTQVTVIQSGSFGAKELYAKWVYGSEGLIFEQVGDEYKVVGYKGNDSEIIVPDTWKSLPVTEIGNGVFENCTHLEKLTLPFVGQRADGLTSNDHFGYIFGADTYVGNPTSVPSSLKTVIITGGTSIAPLAFNRCESLKSVTLPDTVTSIGNAAFNHCTSLESIEIPNSITEISSSVFVSCISLTNVVIPDSVTSIGQDAFGDCTSLTGIIIPDSVKIINQYAFRNCKSLEEITIPFVGATKDGDTNTYFGYIFGASSYSGNSSYVPSSLKTVIITGGTSIDDDAFCKCASLVSIELPDGLTQIGSDAFRDCASLANIKIPASVTSIAPWAFWECISLKNIAISNGVTSIGRYAFYGCTSLKNIAIPDSVISIGSSAFECCTSLEKITLPFVGATKEGTSNTYFGYIFGVGYAGSIPSSLKTVIITGGSTIYSGAFKNCTSLENIEIPDSVTSIGISAFRDCTSLGSIIFGKNSQLTSIEYSAFYNCTSLASITIPDDVTFIGWNAFGGCTRLKSAVFKNTSGWKVGDTSIPSSILGSPSTAAEYLKNTYLNSDWRRAESE